MTEKKTERKLKEFEIPCYWKRQGVLKIKAVSLKDAVDIAMDPATDLPVNTYYVEDSFEVSLGALDCFNDSTEVVKFLEERRQRLKNR